MRRLKGMMNSDMKTKPRRIDVHHHILPPVYRREIEEAGVQLETYPPLPTWTPEASLQIMDRHEISTAILSISSPGVYFGKFSNPRDLARGCNEYIAGLISKYPGRFGGMASLPLPDVNGALDELAYAIDILKLDGICVLSNVNGHYVGEPHQAELFDEINRRGLTLFIHPNTAPSCRGDAFVEYTHDTTRAVASLVASGILARCKKMQLILAHAGGTLPYISDRIILVDLVESGLQGNKLGLLFCYLIRKRMMKRISYDTASSTNEYVLRALVGFARPSQLLFGTNYPWTPPASIHRSIADLSNFAGFSSTEIELLEWRNATKLFPRFGKG